MDPVRPRQLEPEETLDRIAGDWFIYQLRRGQRFSTDDVLVAWAAGVVAPDAQRLLDLGAGIGSVGLMTLWQMKPTAHLTMIEAQQTSHDLAVKSIAHNRLDERVTALLGDLREDDVLPTAARFDLVTGSPPYIPLGKGLISPNPQRAAARMELRGGIYEYCTRAADVLEEGGHFCFVHSAQDTRLEPAVEKAGLTVLSRCDVAMRPSRPPHLTVLVAGHQGTRQDWPELTVRDEEGRWTEHYQSVRSRVGAPVVN